MRGVTFLICTLVVLSARFAAADSYDDCLAECDKAQTACVDAITLFDQTGINEEKQACANGRQECKRKCHDIDDMGKEQYEAQKKKEAEEAEKKRLQEENTINGSIPVMRFDH